MKPAQLKPCKIVAFSFALLNYNLAHSFYIGFFLAILFYLPADAQKYASTGVLNSFTYSEKEGFDNTNYLYTFVASTGKVYTSPYGIRQVLIVGNNYSLTINDDANHALDLVDAFAEMENGEIWVYQRTQMSILRNDSIIRSIRYPQGELLVSAGNTYYSQSEIGKSIYYCDGYRFTKILNNNRFPESGELEVYLNGDSLFVYCLTTNALFIYSVDKKQNSKLLKKIDKQGLGKSFISVFKSDSIWMVYANKSICFFKDSKNYKAIPVPQFTRYRNVFKANREITMDGSPKIIFALDKDRVLPVYQVDIAGKTSSFVPDGKQGSETFYIGASKQPIRAFSYIKKYPAVFNSSNAAEIFSLAQDNKNRIWAASYQSKLSIIDYDKITEVPVDNLHFLNGNIVAGNKMLFFAEEDGMCTMLFNQDDQRHTKLAGFAGFIGYTMPNKKDVYLGMDQYQGLWHTELASLARGIPQWNKIDSTKGIGFRNIVSISSDTLNRVWYGHRGFGVYDPKTGTAKTYTSGKDIDYFVGSMCTDAWGTVWLGSSDNGLHYYEEYTKQVNPKDVKRLIHSLLPDKNRINSLCVWGKWLVIGIENRIQLLDLQRWHTNKNIIIRYLNPQEAAFTSKVEQNIFLIDKRDSSLWFSTSDMLYQWDVKTWLSLPVYRVNPNVTMKKGELEISLSENQAIKIEPTQNSFSLQIWFQSRDNMPRYMSAALTIKGDSVIFPVPSLQTNFDFSNLAPGTYLFNIRIFQSDGTITTHTYSIVVKKFWWQHIWVWIFFALIVLIPIVLWQNSLRKTAILQKKQAEQDSKLANLQLVSLSSQFRPHFILNALNAIGAGSDDKPEQESILSRLGESVNLIFNHAKEQKTTHRFSNEWKLVLNVIEIHKLIYLKELQLTLPSVQSLSEVAYIPVPLGLLQIPVENALLHGLNNRLMPPWNLNISIELHTEFLTVIITDNGVGRIKSATLSNFTKHGTGAKNLEEVIRILNENSDNKLGIRYEDDIYSEATGNYGTKVIVDIPKNAVSSVTN